MLDCCRRDDNFYLRLDALLSAPGNHRALCDVPLSVRPEMPTIRGPEGPKCHCILLAALLLVASAACAQNGGPTEDAFLRQVLMHNPTIRTDSFTLAGARETRTGYTSLLLPQFNVAANAGTYNDFDHTNGYTGTG